MDRATLFAIILALIWGAIWACFLQFTQVGRFLAKRQTWVTVVIGVGMDLAIMLLCVPFEVWLRAVSVVVASSLAIIVRSLVNQSAEAQAIIDVFKDKAGQ